MSFTVNGISEMSASWSPGLGADDPHPRNIRETVYYASTVDDHWCVAAPMSLFLSFLMDQMSKVHEQHRDKVMIDITTDGDDRASMEIYYMREETSEEVFARTEAARRLEAERTEALLEMARKLLAGRR